MSHSNSDPGRSWIPFLILVEVVALAEPLPVPDASEAGVNVSPTYSNSNGVDDLHNDQTDSADANQSTESPKDSSITQHPAIIESRRTLVGADGEYHSREA